MSQQDTNIDPNEETPVLEEMEQIAQEDASTQSGAASSDDEVIKNLQNSLARSQADYQNLLMRVERDKAEMVHFLSAKVLLPLLTQVDNLERAVKTKE